MEPEKSPRMVVAYICWPCYSGNCPACEYVGVIDYDLAVKAQCFCSMTRHVIREAGVSTALYNTAGLEVRPDGLPYSALTPE